MCWICGLGDSLEEELETHSSILVWRIPWTEEPGGLQFVELQRVGHDSRCARAHACTRAHTHTEHSLSSATLTSEIKGGGGLQTKDL